MLRDRPQMTDEKEQPTAQARRRDERVAWSTTAAACLLLPKPGNPGFSALPGY